MPDLPASVLGDALERDTNDGLDGLRFVCRAGDLLQELDVPVLPIE